MNELNGHMVVLPSGATAWLPCVVASEHVGSGTNIGSLSHIGKDVKIGDNCRIQGCVYIADKCIIGNNVFIGPNATLTNDRHPPSGGKWEPVIVEDGVVIGANATIVAGVRLNTGCVIAAGAVVTTDIPANQVWGGVPAKLLMTRDEYNSRRDLN
jgi:acetyltransferase-like isoleucine patch superfamily enzyme